jgi:hypothetical protein
MADNVNAIKDSRNAASGIAPLDANGLLPIANLPTVPTNKGGTGQAGFSVGDILVANSTTTLSKLSPGANGTVLKSNGPGALPSYSNVSAPIASQAEAEAGTDNTKMMTPLRTKEAISALSISDLTMVTFTSSGVWIPPNTITKAFIFVEGGGGGSGACQYSNSKGGSGGSGASASAYITGLSGAYTVTIGEGGAGGTSITGQASSGGTSSFGSLITCTGGTGGMGNGSGATGASGSSGTPTVSSGTRIASAVAMLFGNYGNGGVQTSGTGGYVAGNAGVSGQVTIVY